MPGVERFRVRVATPRLADRQRPTIGMSVKQAAPGVALSGGDDAPPVHATGGKSAVPGRTHLPVLVSFSASRPAGSPSDADMIDSAAFLVRSSAVGQRWAYVLRVVVAFE